MDLIPLRLNRGARGHRASAGFSLLEAMVALLVVGLVGASGFALLHQSVRMAARLADDAERSRAILNTLEIVGRSNPMAQSSGEARLGNCEISWRATQLTPATRNVAGADAGGVFDVALFEVHVRGNRLGQEWFSFNLKQVGFRRTVAHDDVFPR